MKAPNLNFIFEIPAEWKKLAGALEMAMLKRGMTFEIIEWYPGQIKLPLGLQRKGIREVHQRPAGVRPADEVAGTGGHRLGDEAGPPGAIEP